MRTDAGMTGAKFIAVLLAVSLVLTAFMVAPKAAGQEVQYTKRIFGLVGMPSAETIAFCKANGWGIELSLPGSNFRTYFNGDPDTDSYIKIIQSITAQGIPVWLEIEAPIYYDGDISAATTPAQYQSMYGAGLAKYEQLGPLFKGYAFEGGYDNAIIWLKEHSNKQLVAHWLAGYYGAYNAGPPDYKPKVVPEWGTHDMTWRVNQFDEIMWEIYQQDWAESAPQFKQWLDTVAPGKPFGILSGWEPNGGYWWNMYGHNYYPDPPGCTKYTGEQEKALLAKFLTQLKEDIGPFNGIVCDPWNPMDTSTIANACNYMDSLSTTNGAPTPTPSATPTPSPSATPTPTPTPVPTAPLTKLTVSAVNPANNAIDVPITTTITITFNQTIQAGANYSTITLSNGTAVPVTTSIAGTTLTITPNAILSDDTVYTITIPRDAVKNGTTTLTTPLTSTFTTDTPTATPTSTPVATVTPLVVTAVDPANNAINSPITKTITLTLNQKIQAGAKYSTITLKKGTVKVSAKVSIKGNTLTIMPYYRLSYNTAYTITIPRDAVKSGATTLTTPFTSTFTTVKS